MIRTAEKTETRKIPRIYTGKEGGAISYGKYFKSSEP